MKQSKLTMAAVALIVATAGLANATHIRDNIDDTGTEYYPMGYVKFTIDATTAGDVAFANNVPLSWGCTPDVDELAGTAVARCLPLETPPFPLLTSNCGWINSYGSVGGATGATLVGRSYCESDPTGSPSTQYTASALLGAPGFGADSDVSTDGTPPEANASNAWICEAKWTPGTVSSFEHTCLVNH